MNLHLLSSTAGRLTAIGIALGAGAAVAAPTLDVYAQSAGGSSVLGAVGGGFSCATYAPDPRNARYGGGYRVSLPTDGPGCGVVTDTAFQAGPAGPLAVTATATASFGSATDPRDFTGSAAARADYGVLGVRSSAVYSGSVDSSVVLGSGAGALQTETFTFGGAAGSGSVRATFTLDGTLSTRGRVDNELVFSYAVGSGPTFLALRLQDSRGAVSLYAPGGYVASLPGMSVSGSNATGQTIAGSTSFHLDLPMVYGTPLELSFALWAGTLPSSSVGQAFTSAGLADFYASVRLTGLALFDAAGQPVPDFTVVSGSGTVYSAAGVVPEPAAAALWLAGLLALGTWRARFMPAAGARPAGRAWSCAGSRPA